MTKFTTINAFACTICNRQYPNPAEAIACHDSHRTSPNHIEMTLVCTECKEACGGSNCKLARGDTQCQ